MGFFVNQTSINDCGAACLTMILRLNKIKANLNEVKKKLKIDNDGTSAYEIIKLANKYGMKAAGYKNVDIDDIKPYFIAHIIENNLQHFVVVLKICKNKILLADPAKSVMYVDKEDFLKHYTKVAITFEKKHNFIDIKKKNMVSIVLFTLLFTIICIFYSYIFSYVLAINYNKNLKIIILFLLFIVCFLKDIVNYFRCKLSIKFQVLIDELITVPFIKKIIGLPDSYYQQNGSGVLMAKLNDLTYIKQMISSLVNTFFVHLIIVIIFVLTLSIININLLFLNIILLVIITLLSKKIIINSTYNSYDLQIKNEQFSNIMVELLNKVQLIKELSRQSYFENKVIHKYREYIKKYHETYALYNKKNLIIESLFNAFIILICVYLVYVDTTLANLIFIYNIENIIIDSLNSIIMLSVSYVDFKNALKRLKEINNINTDTYTVDDFHISSIVFKHVNFSYNKKKVLNDFSLSINGGNYVMINGKSGVGKTTIFNILLKKTNYNGNNIYINGISHNKIDSKLIRNNIIYIDQKAKLFNGSVKENIFMDSDINEEVLKVCNINNSMLDYVIDGNNNNLSDGQICKIAICQAINTKKSIIVLDEITTSLDEDEERYILQNIKNEFKDITIVLITHRKSNIDIFDKIITI